MDKKNECQICGKPINLEEFDETREIPQLMARKQICFKCTFWFNRLAYDKELEKEGKIAVITRDYSHWVTNHGNQVPPWTASENLGLTSRSDSNTLVTQNESGKTFKVTFKIGRAHV